jgi:LysR family transcriptional regulator, regulator of gene expression of beta-lactamase
MSRAPRLSQLPLNALRAFEASARHLSFTRAGLELRVTQAAVSQQVKGLEQSLGAELFRRLPRGLALTDEGQALLPAVAETFGRLNETLERFKDGDFTHYVTVGVVGWLLPHLGSFAKAHPRIDVRILTNNNRVDLAGEGLDYAIRFGDGAWHATETTHLLTAPLTPLCAPSIAGKLRKPADLRRESLLRSYRPDEWIQWFEAAKCAVPRIKGPIFDSSITMAQAAMQGAGVALLPAMMFAEDIHRGRLVRLFETEIALGAYWLTSLRSKRPTPAMQSFKAWLVDEVARPVPPRGMPKRSR